MVPNIILMTCPIIALAKRRAASLAFYKLPLSTDNRAEKIKVVKRAEEFTRKLMGNIPCQRREKRLEILSSFNTLSIKQSRHNPAGNNGQQLPRLPLLYLGRRK